MNIKKHILSLTIIAALVVFTSLLFVATKNDEKYEKIFLNRVDSSRAMEHIQVLSEDIGIRIATSDKEYESALYIAKEFKKSGYNVEIQPFTYNSSGITYTSWNVVASMKPWTKGNKVDKNDTNEIVYVTAHYDSATTSPGANDNASGVASLLEIAKDMHNIDIDKEVRFIAFGAEEVVAKGSSAYVANLTEDEVQRSVGCFNLDMVATAYEPCTELAVFTSDGNQNVVTDAMKQSGEMLANLSTETVEYNGEFDGELGYSDHISFDSKGIPAALFINVDPTKKSDPISSLEPYYHTPNDNISNVSSERLERTIKLTGLAILQTLNVED